ncbi:hypothetical protein MHZ95_19440 [Sporosarcina sp. ACRSM]|uniref:hypothetical protein n=1 Tax=Sporosarcina sp. ACRSM TaxID=2918216 RepID=UPI001EF51D5C|nr:hypothetical protein [Sporosarcina sp. ACRSM]MCG7337437.1 hypothetical protein [Sporosarcina sp. ACRSM]
MRKQHACWIFAFFTFYALTFLPNFGIFNKLEVIAFLPQPLAWVLLLNAINTIIIFVVYFKFFKPFAIRVEEVLGEKVEGEQI